MISRHILQESRLMRCAIPAAQGLTTLYEIAWGFVYFARICTVYTYGMAFEKNQLYHFSRAYYGILLRLNEKVYCATHTAWNFSISFSALGCTV